MCVRPIQTKLNGCCRRCPWIVAKNFLSLSVRRKKHRKRCKCRQSSGKTVGSVRFCSCRRNANGLSVESIRNYVKLQVHLWLAFGSLLLFSRGIPISVETVSKQCRNSAIWNILRGSSARQWRFFHHGRKRAVHKMLGCDRSIIDIARY